MQEKGSGAVVDRHQGNHVRGNSPIGSYCDGGVVLKVSELENTGKSI